MLHCHSDWGQFAEIIVHETLPLTVLQAKVQIKSILRGNIYHPVAKYQGMSFKMYQKAHEKNASLH